MVLDDLTFFFSFVTAIIINAEGVASKAKEGRKKIPSLMARPLEEGGGERPDH